MTAIFLLKSHYFYIYTYDKYNKASIMAIKKTPIGEIPTNKTIGSLATNESGVSVSVTPTPPSTGKLKDYQVYYNDNDATSKFFQISTFPEKFTSGKNSFLITGTELLLPTTPVAIEVLDVNGDALPVEIPDILINGTDRMIVINISTDSYYGKGLVTILGQARDVPKQWKSVYNVKWQKEVIINPSLNNETDVVFVNDPKLYVTEIYDNEGDISKERYVATNYKQGLVYSKVGKSYLVPTQFSYYLYLQDGPLATKNSLFDGLDYWDTSSAYISDVTASDSKLYFSQSYGLFGITEGVTQNFSMSAGIVYTLNADFKGSESALGSSVASVAVYSGATLFSYLYTTASTDVTLGAQFSSSTDIIATVELSGQAFALNTVWSNVYVANSISASNGNGFITGMEGGKLLMSASKMTVYPNTNLYSTEGIYETTIYQVVNPQAAILTSAYQAYNLNTKNYQRVEFISSSYNISYNKKEYFGSDNVKNSYLELFFTNLTTHVGSLKFVELYKNPGNIYAGKYEVKAYNVLTHGSEFLTITDFTDYWIYGGSGSYANLYGGGGGLTQTAKQTLQEDAQAQD